MRASWFGPNLSSKVAPWKESEKHRDMGPNWAQKSHPGRSQRNLAKNMRRKTMRNKTCEQTLRTNKSCEQKAANKTLRTNPANKNLYPPTHTTNTTCKSHFWAPKVHFCDGWRTILVRTFSLLGGSVGRSCNPKNKLSVTAGRNHWVHRFSGLGSYRRRISNALQNILRNWRTPNIGKSQDMETSKTLEIMEHAQFLDIMEHFPIFWNVLKFGQLCLLETFQQVKLVTIHKFAILKTPVANWILGC